MAKKKKRKPGQRAKWARAGEIELARLDAKRGAELRAETRDEDFDLDEVGALVAGFAATLDDPFLEDMAPSMIGLVATHLAGPMGRVRFGGLEVQPFVARLLAPSTPHAARDIVGFTRALLEMAARFYRWLVQEAYLDRELGEHLASELGLAAIRLVAADAAGSEGLA